MRRLAALRSTLPLLLLPLALAVSGIPAAAGPGTELDAGYLRLVHMTDGLRSVAPKRNLARLKDTARYKQGMRSGIDLTNPPNPLVAHGMKDGQFFYVFYKVVEGLVSDRPYIIQRIKRTVRNWTSLDAPPEEVVSWQIETFKTRFGTLKREDEHFLSYGLRRFVDGKRDGSWVKREIVKEYEIGIGEIPGDAEGLSWPYDAGKLYRLNQKYQDAPGIYDDVKFTKSVKWSLTARFDAKGYALVVPELGIDLPKTLPPEKRSRPERRPGGKDVVLEAGVGAPGLAIGSSAAPPTGYIRMDTFTNGSRDVLHAGDFTTYYDKDGELRSLVTHAPFGGKTKQGIRHGSTRAEVMAKYGVPKRQLTDAHVWRYDGIQFTFDGFHEVIRIGISAKREK